MHPVRVYGRTAECAPVVYPDCGDCGGRDKILLVCVSSVSVRCLFCVMFTEDVGHRTCK